MMDKAKSKKWKRSIGDRVVSITSFVAVFLLLVLAVGGCGKSDGESGGGTGGASGGGTGTSAAKRPVPTDKLVVKGLYIGQPGDDALEACKEIAASSQDLMAVDFRNGIEREKDEATKAAEKKVYEENVKRAESDVDRFLEWNSLQGTTKYDPAGDQCESRDERECNPSLAWNSSQKDAKIPGPSYVFASAMAALAGIYGYQVEWMLPGKPNGGKQAGAHEVKLHTVGRFEIPDKNDHERIDEYWKRNVREGAITDLHGKGFQIPEQYANKACFRLVLQDANGNPVEKKKLATELVLSPYYESIFKGLSSNQEKLELAEKEVDAFLEWVEISGKSAKVFDPSDLKTGREMSLEDLEGAVKNGTISKSEYDVKLKELSTRQAMDENRARGQGSTKRETADMRKRGEEINAMKSKMQGMVKRESALRMRMKELSAELKKVREMKKNASTKERYQKIKEQFAATKEKREKETAAIEALRKQIEEKEKMMKSNAIVKTEEPATTGKRIVSKILGGDPDYFSITMAELSRTCKVMVECAALVEPSDKLTEITETFVIPERDYEGAIEFVGKMDKNLGKWSANAAGSDGSRKKLFFEKELVDLHSHLWFRLVLKNANGVEVAKEEVVKNWLAARGHFPPSDKLILAKKNLIHVAIKKKGIRDDKLPGLVSVWIDNAGNVKEAYFNGDGMNRLFNAGDLSTEEFAQSLVNNYSEIPSLEPKVQRENPGRGTIKSTTWIYKDPKGYQVKLFERAYYNNDGVKYNEKMLESDAEVAMALSLVGKLPTRYFTIFAIKPESARKFD